MMLSSFNLYSVALLSLAIIGIYANAELDLDAIAPPLSMCVIESSDGPVPDDLWVTTEIIVDSKKYPPYQKYIETRGIVLAAISDEFVSDLFLEKVATTLNEMIPDDKNNDEYDRDQQETMIATLARKRTFIPIVTRFGFDPLSAEEYALVEEIRGTHSSCDMIFELGMENPRQPMEVTKILLLHFTLIGLHYLLPEEWGMTTRSQLFEELELSDEDQYLNVELTLNLAMVPPDALEEVIDDVLLKQYSFWLLATWMDIVEDYGPNDVENEWQLKTPTLLEDAQPSAWDLCDDYLKSLLASPTNLADYGPTDEEVQAAEEEFQQAQEDFQQEQEERQKEDAAATAAALLADPLRPLGNCVSTTEDGPVPEDLWSTTEIMVDDTYPPFQKYIATRGIIFAARDIISDDFLQKVATTVNQLIPDEATNEDYDRTKQEDMITILAQKRTFIPIVPYGIFFSDLSTAESDELDTIQDKYSSCDVIIQLAAGDPNQPMDVVKHVLHHVNMVGLNYLLHDQWGMNQQSELFEQLIEASKKEFFNIESYKNELGNKSAELDQILLQQYSYWLIATWMDIVEDYGPPKEVVEQEWQLYTPKLLEGKQPQAYALCADTLTDLLATPTNLPEYDTRTDAEKEEDEKMKAAAEKEEKDEPDKKDNLAVEIVEVKGEEPDKKEEFETDTEMETEEDKDGSAGDPSDEEEEEEEEGDVDEEETSEADEEGPLETAADVKTIVIEEWVVPYTGPRQVSANVGDTITFEWAVEGAHNVYLHKTMDCSLKERSEVGLLSPTSYTFTEADGSVDGNPMFFSCDISDGSHCEAGQNLIANVYSSSGDSVESSGSSSMTTISTASEEDESDEDEPDEDDRSGSKSGKSKSESTRESQSESTRESKSSSED